MVVIVMMFDEINRFWVIINASQQTKWSSEIIKLNEIFCYYYHHTIIIIIINHPDLLLASIALGQIHWSQMKIHSLNITYFHNNYNNIQQALIDVINIDLCDMCIDELQSLSILKDILNKIAPILQINNYFARFTSG